MKLVPPAHKVIGDTFKPGQTVNPVNTDMMDDMGHFATPEPAKRVTWNQETQQERIKRYEELLRAHNVPF